MADDQMNALGRENQDHEVNQVENVEQTPPTQPESSSANPPMESDRESQHSESTESEQQEEEHVGPHIQPLVSRHQLAWQYTQHFGIQTLLWLQLFWNFLSLVFSTTQTISKGIARSIQSKDYIFFQGSNYPYRQQDFTSSGPGVAPVEWYYNADEKMFISAEYHNSTTEYITRHLDWLSAQVKYNNLVLYDITDFLQQVRWAGRTKPSAARVMAAWSLQSGVVLTSIDGISLQTINEDGTESTIHFRA